MAIAIFTLFFLNACKKEPVPAYIHIEGFTLLANPGGFVSSETTNEGSLSHKISDAWVYVDEQLIGCFEMPCTFPVLSEGSHHIKIRPGIKVNGISATRAPYPFFKIYEQDIDFQEGVSITLSPTTMYQTSSHFVFMEDFEGIDKIDTTSNSQVDLDTTQIPSLVFEGNASGFAYLANGNSFFECISTFHYPLPHSNVPVFLEFNYRCDKEITVATIAESPYHADVVLNLNPSPNWNKAYLFLSPTIGPNSSTYFKILMYVSTPGTDSTAFLIDNIKIVY